MGQADMEVYGCLQVLVRGFNETVYKDHRTFVRGIRQR